MICCCRTQLGIRFRRVPTESGGKWTAAHTKNSELGNWNLARPKKRDVRFSCLILKDQRFRILSFCRPTPKTTICPRMGLVQLAMFFKPDPFPGLPPPRPAAAPESRKSAKQTGPVLSFYTHEDMPSCCSRTRAAAHVCVCLVKNQRSVMP